MFKVKRFSRQVPPYLRPLNQILVLGNRENILGYLAKDRPKPLLGDVDRPNLKILFVLMFRS